jgi:hypothetical protein
MTNNTSHHLLSLLEAKLPKIAAHGADVLCELGSHPSLIQNLIIDEIKSYQGVPGKDLERQALVFLADTRERQGRKTDPHVRRLIDDPDQYSALKLVRDNVTVKPKAGEYAVADIYDALEVHQDLRVLFLRGRRPAGYQRYHQPADDPGESRRLLRREKPKPKPETNRAGNLAPVADSFEFHVTLPSVSPFSDDLLRRLGVIDEQGNPAAPSGKEEMDYIRKKIWNVAKGGMVATDENMRQWACKLAEMMGLPTEDLLPPRRASRG